MIIIAINKYINTQEGRKPNGERQKAMGMNEKRRFFHNGKYKEKKMHTCNIIYNDCNRGVPNVTWDQTPESFLSCSIPEKKRKKIK